MSGSLSAWGVKPLVEARAPGGLELTNTHRGGTHNNMRVAARVRRIDVKRITYGIYTAARAYSDMYSAYTGVHTVYVCCIYTQTGATGAMMYTYIDINIYTHTYKQAQRGR